MKLLIALKNRAFALLLAGQTISRIGDHLYQLVLAWWVLQKTGSALDMGVVMVCSFTPLLIFLLIGGAAVDRLNRVGVMLASDLVRAALVLVVAGMAMAGHLRVWEVYVASLLFGFVDAFFNPAYTAAIPELVSAEHLNSANALTSLGTQLGRIAGPPLGALLIATAGTAWAMAINGASFTISAACLVPLMIKRRPANAEPFQPDEGDAGIAEPLRGGPGIAVEMEAVAVVDRAASTDSQKVSMLRDVRDGIGFVLGRPWLWVTILMCTAANVLLGGPYSVTLPFLIQKARGWDVRMLGLVYAMFPVGYAIAAVVSGQMSAFPRRGVLIFLSMAVGGAAIAVIGMHVPLGAIVLAAIINGFALEVGGLAWTRAMQEKVPSEMLGRVSSIDSLGSFALLPVGYALAGWATDAWGPAWVFIIGGSATCIAAVAGLSFRSVREME